MATPPPETKKRKRTHNVVFLFLLFLPGLLENTSPKNMALFCHCRKRTTMFFQHPTGRLDPGGTPGRRLAAGPAPAAALPPAGPAPGSEAAGSEGVALLRLDASELCRGEDYFLVDDQDNGLFFVDHFCCSSFFFWKGKLPPFKQKKQSPSLSWLGMSPSETGLGSPYFHFGHFPGQAILQQRRCLLLKRQWGARDFKTFFLWKSGTCFSQETCPRCWGCWKCKGCSHTTYRNRPNIRIQHFKTFRHAKLT